MATRMQQRRGTAAQWISTNAGAGPVLNAGEIGWESDTNKFKIGDGVNNWTSLDYFADVDSTVNPAFGTSITFEGATADSYETILQVTDPTADRTITFPDATGTVALTSDIAELSQDAIDSALTAGTGITKTYNDGEDTLTLAVDTTTIQARVADVSDTEIGYLNGVTSAIQTQLDAKAPTADASFTGTFSAPEGTITSTMIADGTIVNADINASAAIAQSKIANLTTDLGLKAPLADPTFTGTVSGVTKAHVGLGNVDNTSDADKAVSTATQTALDLKAPLADPTFTGTISAASLTLSGDLTVNGTTTNINSTSLVVEDKNIILGDVETPTDTTADGGGITLKGATDKTFNWVDATDSWTSSEHINLASGKSLYLNGTLLKDVSETLTNKTLTTPVISSISNTGTLTLPTATDTLVGRATTDTLTNKSISLTTNTVTGTLAEFNTALSDDNFVSLTGSETLTNKTLTSAIAGTSFTLNATAELRLADTDSSHYVGFKAPGTVSTNRVWTLPAADGDAGQVLTTDGSGTFSFSTPAAGAAFSELMLIGA